MLVYRIVQKKYSDTLFASGIEGRWNSKGNKVLYCSESIALAFLENMVRRQGIGFNMSFKIMIIKVPSKLRITLIDTGDLSKGWRDSKNYLLCQSQGDAWYRNCKTLLLKAPSAVLPESFNYVINTEHTDYKKVKLIETTDLIPDERIEKILKRLQEK